MYRLIIKNSAGNWQDLDLGDDRPAMGYQVNDIAELKNRNADGSQAIRLPKTDNNVLAFNFASAPDTISRAPYIRHECRLFSNDYVLAGAGSYLVFDRITEYFEVQILSGNANFFNYLKDNALESLNLGEVELSLNSMKAPSDKYLFPAATYDLISFDTTNTLNTIDLNKIYPCMYLKYIIDTMVATHGFTLVHNIPSSEIDNKLISLSSLKPNENSFDAFMGYNANTATLPNKEAYLIWAEDLEHNANGLLRPFTEESVHGIEFESNIDGEIVVRVEYSMLADLTGLLSTIDGEEHYRWSFDSALSDDRPITVEVSRGDKVRLWLKPKGSDTGQTATYKFSVESLTSSVVPFGGTIPLSKNLDFKTQLDLFKAFAQLFGLVVSVDNVNKIVYAYTYEKIYENKGIAKDWSDKLHLNEIETTFELSSYAQVNTIAFNENAPYKDVGTFIIDNKALAPSKELFKIDFQAGIDYSHELESNIFITANIPLLEKDKTTGMYTFKDGKPHILNKSDKVKLPLKNSAEAIELHTVKHATAQSFIDAHYGRLVNYMLKDAKKIEASINLTEFDIEMFDKLIPVYLNYYGAYFYVNKINNFISGRLTKCELIKL